MTPLLLLAALAAPTAEIKVDQVGYLPDGPKVAFVVAKAPATAFTVRRVGDGGVAFEGKLTAAVVEPDSGDSVQAADFTALTKSGTYTLDVPGVGRSWDFAIGADVFVRPFSLAMRSFYGQRCGTAVDLGPAFPGYKHAACHLEGGYHASSGKSGAGAPHRRLARRGRLRPLRGQLRPHHRHACCGRTSSSATASRS